MSYAIICLCASMHYKHTHQPTVLHTVAVVGGLVVVVVVVAVGCRNDTTETSREYHTFTVHTGSVHRHSLHSQITITSSCAAHKTIIECIAL